MSPFIVYTMNPDADFKPVFMINLLEETEEQFVDSIFSIVIFWKHNVIIDSSRLNSLSELPLTDSELKLVDSVQKSVETILSHCYIFDRTYHPTGIFANCKNVVLKHGYREYTTIKESNITIREDKYRTLSKVEKAKFKFLRYVQNDSKEHLFAITDNVNLIEEESTDGHLLTKQQSISKWSTTYGHKQMQKNYGVTIIDIVQQNAASEQQQYTNKGSNIVEKLKPSREGYGDNKIIARNADLILGLFAPSFYGIHSYLGYDLSQISDNFRSIIILKNRLGRGFREIPLFFNGAVNYFAELTDSRKLTKEHVKLIKGGLYRTKVRELYTKESK